MQKLLRIVQRNSAIELLKKENFEIVSENTFESVDQHV